jgi:hypothetical protein
MARDVTLKNGKTITLLGRQDRDGSNKGTGPYADRAAVTGGARRREPRTVPYQDQDGGKQA